MSGSMRGVNFFAFFLMNILILLYTSIYMFVCLFV